MMQKGFAQILILVGIIGFSILVGSTLYFIKFNNRSADLKATQDNISTSPVPPFNTQSVNTSTIKIHLADDAIIPINNVKLNLILFQPKGVQDLPYSGWEKNANDWFDEVISFWRRELDNKTNITFEIYPTVYKASKNASDYDFNSVYQEVYPWFQQQSMFITYFNKTTTEFPIFFIYVLGKQNSFYQPKAAGNHIGNLGFVVASLPTDFLSSFFMFYSEDSRVHGRGQPAQEAHEMGHALGLQHSNDNPNIKTKYLKGNTWTSDCDLMVGHLGEGYIQNINFSDNATLLDTRCILPEQKQLFFK